MKIYDRMGHEIIVDQSQNNLLKLLYSHVLGRCVLKVLTLPFITQIGGKYMNSSLSKHKIQSFIEHNHIDMSQYVEQDYKSYNDFFTRKIKEGKRPVIKDENILVAPADSKLTYYPITDDLHLNIKDTCYTLSDLLNNNSLAEQFVGGTCLIFRLTVDDYHRYCFIDDGKYQSSYAINGQFHTVNPIASYHYKIYKTNSRYVNVLDTAHFGQVIAMEVGAMMVGKIKNISMDSFKRGMIKGWFEFGGSTVVLLFKENTVRIDQDIVDYSMQDIEVKVKMGEKIGVAIRKEETYGKDHIHH